MSSTANNASNSLKPSIRLSPTQSAACDEAVRAVARSQIVMLWGAAGRGKSTILECLHARFGGGVVRAAEVVNAVASGHPMAIEEGFYHTVRRALDAHEFVFVDDLDATTGLFLGCHYYPRAGWFEAAALALAMYALERGRRLILAGKGTLPTSLRERADFVKLERLGESDYAHLCGLWLTADQSAAIRYDKVHRFAPNLSAHQLRGACAWLATLQTLDTDSFVDFLRAQRLISNVALDDVAAVDLRSLRGVDDVIDALEKNVVLPLEHDELVARYGLRPKRGVLLAGPPGTGKTTVGRALARRLKGKFLLIDGTVISGTRDFYQRITELFAAAQENAPAVIFIDDGDVLFEDKNQLGLYRYLLTKLDGLESEKTGQVCVMMTAMDVGSLPPALVRSGRIELWLQMRLPDDVARAQILSDLTDARRKLLGDFDAKRIVAETAGFTGADLKRTVEDAKLFLASDLAGGAPQASFTEYLLRAAAAARQNKQMYAEAVTRARASQPASDGPDGLWRFQLPAAGSEE